MTRLERFLKAHEIKIMDLARACGYSRQHLLRLRQGAMEPTRPCIAAIVDALSRLSETAVRPEELFVLSGDTLWEQQQARLSRHAAVEQKRLRAEAGQFVSSLEAENLPVAKWMEAIQANGGPTEAIANALYQRGRALTFEKPSDAERMHRLAAAVAARLPRDTAALSIHGRAHMGGGNALATLSDYPGAFAAFDDAESVLTESPDCIRELAEVWYSRARTHFSQTAYEDGKRWARRSGVIFEAVRNERMGAVARLLEGAILYEMGHPAEAERLLRTTLDPLERARDRASVAFACLNIGRCNIDLGEVDTARVWLQKARAMFSKLKMSTEVVRAEWCLGWLRALHEDLRRGLEDLYRQASYSAS